MKNLLKNNKNKIIARWLWIGVVMLIVQILLGGITRLTGSGLSITEWKPIMGFIPPTSQAEWELYFTKYKDIAQYKYLNNHFSIDDFKFIFFWEWFHRLWARLIAVAFLFPFVYFLYKKYFDSQNISFLMLLFGLGILQGAVGWIMVKSGLNDSDLYVNHIKLSIHFVLACILTGYLFFYYKNVYRKSFIPVQSITISKSLPVVLLLFVLVQLFYGGLLAGLKGATFAPTWPDINGAFIPEIINPSAKNILFFNPLTIHFIHRGLAYIILGLIIIFTIKYKFDKSIIKPFIIVLMQVILGISTVLLSPRTSPGNFRIFEWIAFGHQFVSVLLWLSIVDIISKMYFFKNNKSPKLQG